MTGGSHSLMSVDTFCRTVRMLNRFEMSLVMQLIETDKAVQVCMCGAIIPAFNHSEIGIAFFEHVESELLSEGE